MERKRKKGDAMGEGVQPHGQILVYAAEDGRLKIDVRMATRGAG